MDIEKFKASASRLLKKAKDNQISIEEIKKILDDEICNIESQKNIKKKSRKKKICRPVLMISDSSCDEMSENYFDSTALRSSLSNSLRLPTNS